MTRGRISKRFVIDASVALKWYLPEKDSKRARKWYEAIKNNKIFAIAPDFLIFECANVLLKRHHLKLEDCIRVINDLKTIGIQTIPLSALRTDTVIQLADNYKITVYDALYVELARLTNINLLTADSELLKSVKKLTRKL